MENSQQYSIVPTVLATLGTILLSVQLVPQIWYNWRRHDTEGLPALMMLLWALCAVPMGPYFIVQKANISLQIQPQVFATLNLLCWGQILTYSHAYGRLKATAMVVSTAALFGLLELLTVLAAQVGWVLASNRTIVDFTQGPFQRGITWPILLLGVLSVVFIVGGLLMPYLEVWKRRGRVVGISWLFLGMDMLGGLCSLLALMLGAKFDILGGVMYIVVIALEAGLCLSHIVWRQRHGAKETLNNASDLSVDRSNDVETV
ncbi:hypothetical protein FE257_002194 [Aspergillus nanangensis]|uniref:PQ loop repeat protein n=1 Tax=Aspergillus nanangensis TaxID=2582783 RepID=A0AAD4GQB1_ASPNN|nr:hypothetical protein FE257_002194 [Aspergillus nanangensis]